jgi:hypothetical protein
MRKVEIHFTYTHHGEKKNGRMVFIERTDEEVAACSRAMVSLKNYIDPENIDDNFGIVSIDSKIA